MRSVRVARIPIGDVEDPVIYAGMAIHEWEKGQMHDRLKEYRMAPTMWKLGLSANHYGYTVDLWCEDYQEEDLILAQLAGLILKD